MSLNPADPFALAIEIVAQGVLAEVGLEQAGAAAAWAQYWSAQDGPGAEAALQRLAIVLAEGRWPASKIVDVHLRLAAIASGERPAQIRRLGARERSASASADPSGATLVRLLATIEEALLFMSQPTAPASRPEEPPESAATAQMLRALEAMVAGTNALTSALDDWRRPAGRVGAAPRRTDRTADIHARGTAPATR